MRFERLAGDAADAAADEEILIQNGDRAEGGFGIGEDLAQDRIEGGLALGLGLLGLLGLRFRRGGRPRAGELG